MPEIKIIYTGDNEELAGLLDDYAVAWSALDGPTGVRLLDRIFQIDPEMGNAIVDVTREVTTKAMAELEAMAREAGVDLHE